MWSLNATNSDDTFANNTVSQPNLANGIAIYGGRDITGTTIKDSPYSAYEFVSGGGTGKAVKNVTVDGSTVDRVGTVVVQAETPGAVRMTGVEATGVGAAGIYNCPYPAGSGTFALTDGGGNSGWDSVWDDCSTWPKPGGGNPDPDPNRNLAKGRPAIATGSADVYTPGKAVDGDASTYWES